MKHTLFALAALCSLCAAGAYTTAPVPADGVYRFTFGVSSTADGSIPVPAAAVYDVNGSYTGTFSYGFLGTAETSYLDDIPADLPSVPHAIDGFKVVKGQQIVLRDGADANGVPLVAGPAAADYLPAGASAFEGRYPVRFSMRADERGYYAVTCTVANASATAPADVTLFSERCHTHAQHLSLAPGETKTFAWSVELAPNFFKGPAKFYNDNAINVVVAGENAALASLAVVKQPQRAGTVRGAAVADMNEGRTMWLCDDSTGTDQRCDTPYFALQNYAGVGSGLSRWAPPDLSIRNQGEGGLATNAGTHRKSCLLKPGDYLYVQYGHNESSTQTYAANLEQYLADADAAGAYLVVVSPVERRSSWNSATSTWNRSLQGYAEAAEAWVESKIAAGATNVAFLDLNKRFNDWQNAEIVRVNAVDPAVSLESAINYYYQSTKGGKVDVSHPNNAGADWGAYCVWQEVVSRIAAGEAEGASESARIQAAVLKGIASGVASRVASDEPWHVSDEIIAAGSAPNSFWDAPVKAGYDFIHPVAIASVDAAVESDGSVALSGVAMRVMNQSNYLKAVVDVENPDGSLAARYYSHFNYDASGTAPGGIVRPASPGFIDADLDKNADPAGHFSESVSIPAGMKAYVYFAEADGATWQVGSNARCSAKYPVEAWNAVLADDDCTDASRWGAVTKDAVHTFAVPSGEDYIAFTSTSRNSGGYHSELGFYRDFDDGAEISSGRYRVSFKARYVSGNYTFYLGNSHGSNKTPLEGALALVQFANTAATVFGSNGAGITLSADETPVPQNAINVDTWLDVDMIVDMALGKASVSIGGGDYQTFSVAEYADPDEIEGLPYKYFGFRLWTYNTHEGAIDDVKVIALSPTPAYTVSAAANSSLYGTVEINGKAAASREITAGKTVALKAASADEDRFKFVEWRDAEGNRVSTKTTLAIENLSADCSYTAVFAPYGADEDRVKTWDFSEYAAAGVSAASAASEEYDGATIHLLSGDAISADGIRWADTSLKAWNGTVASDGRYFEWTAPADGVFSVVFQTDQYNSNDSIGPYLCVVTNEMDMVYKSAAWTSKRVTAANTDMTLSFSATSGETYKIYTYYQNRSCATTISSISFARPAPDMGDIDTHSFVWNPAVSQGAWNDPANWLYEGISAAATYPSDASQDVAVFSSPAAVTLPADAAASNIWCNAAVSFSGGKTLSAKMMAGGGALTLDAAGLSNVSGKSLVVSNDLAIAGASWVNALSSTVELRGDISGAAPLAFWLNDSNASRVRLYGNNNGYTGDAKVTGGYKTARRSVFSFENEHAAGTNAYWTVEYNAASYNKDEYRMVRGTTRFGGYWGEISDTQNGVRLVIGHLNRASYIFPVNPNGGREFDVEKVGTADLKIGNTLVRNLTLRAGSVTPAIGTAFNELSVADETTVYFAGDAAWQAGVVTNLCIYATLSGEPRVVVTDLAEGLEAEVSVADGVVAATIKKRVAEIAVDDGEGNSFGIPATLAPPEGKELGDIATGSITYAQAYALGLWDGTAAGGVAEPEVAIDFADGEVKVSFAAGEIPAAYTVECKLQTKAALDGAWQDVAGAAGAPGEELVDSNPAADAGFYRVLVTIK